MKLPFISKIFLEETSPKVRVAVFLSDWCPACLEYKVVLNKVLSSTQIEISFLSPGKYSINVIPSTFFVKGKGVIRHDGFMTYEQFLCEYNAFSGDV